MKIILVGILMLLGLGGMQAQDGRLYWKYKDYDGAVAISAPHWVFNIGSLFVPERDDRRLIRQVRKMRVLVFDGATPVTASDRRKFEKRAERRGLGDLLAVRDGNTHVRIMGRDRRNVLRKVVVFVQSPEEFVLVSVRGKLNLSDLGKLLQTVGEKGNGAALEELPVMVKQGVERM